MIASKAPQSLLVLGGARSGKSRYAQRLAEASGRRPVLIATAEACDAEMAARIARHAAARDARWSVIEAPLELAATLRRDAGSDRIIVVDCVTVWLGNVFHRALDPVVETRALVDTVAGLEGPVIFVSNEVGGGIVPDNALARAFRDAQGTLNQALAEACEAVVFMTAGIALPLKPGLDANS
jgi:adenosylcobinamide kinase/adenosylcobinamide-phosphate guanylyltransferase